MPIVTLASDIGMQDYIIGAVKGQLLSSNASVSISDITHFLAQSNFPEAAYICSNAYTYYPPNTIHIIFINFYETLKNYVLLVEYNNQYIICADNGLITMLTNNAPINVYRIDVKSEAVFLDVTKKIAETCAEIFKGKHPKDFLKVPEKIIEKNSLKPLVGEDWIRGHIIFIDNFENVVVNITKPLFDEQQKGRNFNIVIRGKETIETISNNYFDVTNGEKLAWFNSAGYLEIAINKGNIAGLFGLQGFNEIMYKEGKAMQNKWFYSNVTIMFS
jgi:S-adenosyl-L-methionine hydrolase (adenosine-forming)